MKKILISLTLLLTISMASTETSHTTDAQNISKLTKGQIILREARTSRTARESRNTRENSINEREVIKDLSSFRIARINREVREERLIVQILRESRNIRHVFMQEKLHLASLK